jgi:class 3 adenylate cyclase/Tfp pilus assembly protein PilF
MNELLRLDWTERPLRRRLAAIAFLDVVGYARLVATDEEATLQTWSELRHSVIEPHVISWRGRIVDRAGDGIFAEFGSALEALHWAVNVQTATERHIQPGERIRLRIAVHLADVIDGPDGEVQGDGVNVTSRLQTYADAGGVIVSQAVVDAVQGKTDAVFADLGMLKLKNISQAVRAFRLTGAPVPRQQARVWRCPVRMTLSVSALLLILLTPVFGLHPTAREHAEDLLKAGMAVPCPTFPCARAWLEKRKLFEQAMAADPMLARPYAEAAIIYANFLSSRMSTDTDSDFRTGASLATRAVALAPDEAFAYNAKGAVLRQNPDKLEEALAAYMRVLSIDPGHIYAKANAGWLLLLLGRPAEAEPYVQAALEADPANTSKAAWLNRMGMAELFLDRHANAVDFFRRSITAESTIEDMTDFGLERTINLAAALALDGDVAGGRQIIDRLRLRYPTLSTNNMWTCTCSHAPRFLAGMEKLRQGAMLAGVVDTN